MRVRAAKPMSPLCLGLGLLLAAPASGATPRRFSLDYRAEVACPGEAELLRQIARRVPQATRITQGRAEIDAQIRIERDPNGLRGQIALTGADGLVQREVAGTDCEEIVRASALIVALALDPDAESTSAPEPPQVTPLPATPPRPMPYAAARYPLWVGAGVLAGAASGVAPSVSAYQGLYVGLGMNDASWFSPSVRLAALRTSNSTETALGGVELDWTALRLWGCPLRVGTRLFAQTCVTFDVGRLRGSGYATHEPRARSSLWYGPGGALGLGAILFDVITLGADVGVVAPLARDRFYFAPDVTAHRVPTAAAYAGFGLGFRR